MNVQRYFLDINSKMDLVPAECGIAGLAIESSTFSPAKTIEEDFKARVDEEVFTYYPFLNNHYVF